jgi:hypothetical protein
MDERWTIWIRGEREGPYTAQQLRDDERVTGNTPAWREGMPRPLPIAEIPTLMWILAFKKLGSTRPAVGQTLTNSSPQSPRGLLLWVLFSCIIVVLWFFLSGRR